MLPEIDFTPVWALVGTNLIAVLAAVFWLPKRIFEHQLAKRMAEIEKKHDVLIKRYDHYARFSQSTFERLFEKKVAAYEKLMNLHQELIGILEEGKRGDEPEDIQEGVTSVMLETRSVIETSRLYISSSLSNAYENWFSAGKAIFESANTASVDTLRHSFGTKEDEMNAAMIEDITLQALAEKTIVHFLDIFKQVDEDVQIIRMNLEQSLVQE